MRTEEEYRRSKAQGEARKRDNYAKGWRRYFSWWKNPTDRFAGLLFFATLITAFILYKTDEAIKKIQAGIMQGQLVEMKATSAQTDSLIAANKKLADAAVSQAAAAAKSAQFAEDALKLTKTQLRAYVVTTLSHIFNVDNRNSPVIVYPQFTNTGQTEARRVERSVGISMRPPSDDFREAVLESGTLDIGAGRVTPAIERSLSRALTREETESVKRGQDKIYVFGFIKFQDAFGDTQESSFCFAFSGSGQDFPGNGGFGYPNFMAKSCVK